MAHEPHWLRRCLKSTQVYFAPIPSIPSIPPIPPIPLLFLLLPLLIGCQFEGDEALRPQTTAAYILQRMPEGHRIVRHAGEEVDLDWRVVAGLSPAEIGGLDGHSERFWVGGNGVLWQCSPQGEVEQTMALDSFSAHFVRVGYRTLLMTDTLRDELLFMDLRRETVVRRKLDSVAGQPLYSGGYFYLAAGHRVKVYQELAYAPVAEAVFERPVVDLQVDWRARIQVYTGTRDSLYQAVLDYNSHRVTSPEQPVNIRKERQSPYRKAYFGQELTTRRTLGKNGQFLRVRGIDDFEYDFFSRRAYLLKGDSLQIYHESQDSLATYFLGTGAWLHSWYHPSAVVD